MKKLVVLLLALAMVAGAVSAQVAVSGYDRALLQILDGSVSMTNRLRLNFKFDDPDGNFGAFGRLRLQFASVDANSPSPNYDFSGSSVRYAYAWAKMFNGAVKVTAGLLGNYDYEVDNGISDIQLGNFSSNGYVFDRTYGALLQLYPIEGLDIGVGVLASPDEVNLNNFSLNAKYTIKDIGNIIFSSKGAAAFEDAMESIAFQFQAVEGLDATVGFMHGGKAYYQSWESGVNSIYANVDFSVGGFSFEVSPNYNLTDSELYIEGYVSYAMDAIQVNVLGAYDESGEMLAGVDDYFFGLEFLYKIGKATLTAGYWYDDLDTWSVPVIVKVAF